MKSTRTLKSTLAVASGLALGWLNPPALSAAGFPSGHLIVADYQGIHVVNPSTGATQTIVTGDFTEPSAIVYNPVSDTAFMVMNSSNICQITASAQGAYTVSTFLAADSAVNALAVDRQGRLYFNESSGALHAIRRVDLQGHFEMLSAEAFFVPRGIALSTDESQLFVSESPANRLSVLTLSSQKVRTLSASMAFPGGAVALASGDVLVAENPGLDSRIVRVSPNGDESTYATLPSQSYGQIGAIAFDEANGTLYISSGDGVYGIPATGTPRHVTTYGGWSGCLALIRQGATALQIATQPQDLVVGEGDAAEFRVAIAGSASNVRYQWRFNNADLPGATGSSLRIPSVRASSVGTYTVSLTSDSGSLLSRGAVLAISTMRLLPVMVLDGPVGTAYSIQYQDRLDPTSTGWHELTNVSTTSTPFYFIDPEGVAPGQRFYRASVLP